MLSSAQNSVLSMCQNQINNKKKKHASCFLIIDNAGSHYLKSLSRDGSVSSRDRNIEILAAEMFKLNLESEAH